jgi:hypothetical protein
MGSGGGIVTEDMAHSKVSLSYSEEQNLHHSTFFTKTDMPTKPLM